MKVRRIALVVAGGLAALYQPLFRRPFLTWGATDARNRFRLPTLAARLAMLPTEPGSLVAERKMLRGIKERAERLSRHADGVQSPY